MNPHELGIVDLVLTGISSMKEQKSRDSKASRRLNWVEAHMGEVMMQMEEVKTQIGDI